MEEKSVSIGLFDLLLPGRQFIVHHKVAEVGQVSLTTEFLLRLLYSVDGLEEEQIAQFFGFNATEMSFAVNEAEARDFVERQDGCVWLSDAGYALFKDSDRPQIFEVLKRSEKAGFDLLSMAPCERDNLSDFERALPELDIVDAGRVGMASQEVPDAFRRHYRDFVGRKDRDVAAGVRRSLYSIDEVIPADRFSSVVPVLAVANVLKPGEPAAVLEAWRNGHELEDRGSVVHSVATFIDNLKTVRQTEDERAYRLLLEIAPDYLKEYRTRDGLSVNRFFKETASRAGELRADRRTVGIVGPLYSPENIERIRNALEYSSDPGSDGRAGDPVWVVPGSPVWGASRALLTLLDSVAQACYPGSVASKTAIAVLRDRSQKHLRKAFNQVVIRSDDGEIPSSLEILLVPHRVVAVVVNAPIGLGRGFPVPLGVLSFEQEVVRRAHEFLEGKLRTRTLDSGEQIDWHALLLWEESSQQEPATGPARPGSPETT
ncbi:conserved hypothetical protein [Cupriavidus neocaledonicus]|uniref:Uncharacterized protein n=1 Tax=Cupriavidus neocaledonicus TaxID=1040979 RepID=A0ABY1V0L2_9BURK|nr:conserved hypothetical protein [Cupriavidus neocaledonicus]